MAGYTVKYFGQCLILLIHSSNFHYSRFRVITEEGFVRKALKYQTLKSRSDNSLLVFPCKLPSLACSMMYELCVQLIESIYWNNKQTAVKLGTAQ